jgi:hypothetical protein
LVYDHVTHVKTINWGKDSTIENETINFPRQSLKAVVMLFRKKTPDSSEEFVFPNIGNVKVTVEGTPNQVYSQGISKGRFYEEAKRVFGKEGSMNPLMTLRSFYDNHFALVVDLRSIEDNSVYKTGRKLTSTQSGIQLEIQKKATTTDLDCHMFIISDSIVQIMGGGLSGVVY